MDYISLGSTGLRVSIAGLGCGGSSRLGLGTGKSADDAIALVHAALDLGINLFDTAEAYGTEAVLGQALAGRPRHSFVVSSKTRILDENGNRLGQAAVLANLDQSLRRLRLDHIDVFHLHAVHRRHYEYALTELAPLLQRQKEAGKIAHLGITETPPRDFDQLMLSRALQDSCWEAVMLAFHMMNQRPGREVIPRARSQGVGTLLMFVVRSIFSRPSVLRTTMAQLVQQGQVPAWLAQQPDPLGFLVHPHGAQSVTDAAYRFARHESGADVVLFGTGDIEHLRSNVASLLRPPLPRADVEQLRSMFGQLRGIGLVFPDNPRGAGLSLQSV